MKALVLAAGYATRLYPLTKEYPKSLLAVGPKPIINYIIEKLEALDTIDEIIVVTNSKFFPIFRDWKRRLNSRIRLSIIDDLTKTNETRRGSVGDINFVINRKKIKDDFLVIGGDNLFDGGLEDFISFSKSLKGSPVIGVYDIGDKANAKHYGVIKLDRKKRVVDFQEKPQRPKSSLVGMCLYYFPRQRLKLIKKYLSSKIKTSDASGSYIDWLKGEVPVYAFVFSGRWFDIGDFKYLNEAQKAFE